MKKYSLTFILLFISTWLLNADVNNDLEKDVVSWYMINKDEGSVRAIWSARDAGSVYPHRVSES